MKLSLNDPPSPRHSLCFLLFFESSENKRAETKEMEINIKKAFAEVDFESMNGTMLQPNEVIISLKDVQFLVPASV